MQTETLNDKERFHHQKVSVTTELQPPPRVPRLWSCPVDSSAKAGHHTGLFLQKLADSCGQRFGHQTLSILVVARSGPRKRDSPPRPVSLGKPHQELNSPSDSCSRVQDEGGRSSHEVSLCQHKIKGKKKREHFNKQIKVVCPKKKNQSS